MKALKIQRTADVPELDDPSQPERHPLRLRTPLDALGYDVHFHRGRWWPFYTDEADPADEAGPYSLPTRGTVAWATLDGRRVAGVKLVEYDLQLVSNQTIWFAMDEISSSMERVAHVLTSCWEGVAYDVAGFGQVAEIRMVWLEKGHLRPEIWAPIVSELLRRVKYSVAIALAFPTEYEGRMPEGTPLRHAFERRRRAMQRHYGRLLKMEPLPSPLGAEGWLWRRRPGLESIINEPEYDETRDF